MSQTIIRNVSLARALSKLGYTSRSQGAQLILDGKVSLNGRVVTNPDVRCSLEHDRIAVEGKNIQEKEFKYLVLNKPTGYVTTRSDERGRKTVYDLLTKIEGWLFPVGRLDKDTSGLLLFTNDHRLGEQLTNPSSGISKTYNVLLDRPLEPEDRHNMESGMMLDNERLLPAVVRLSQEDGSTPGVRLEMVIHEGKNRQIRRMLSALGYDVLELHRSKVGGYEMKNIKSGEWKYLTLKEVSLFTARR